MYKSIETQKNIWSKVAGGAPDYSFGWGNPESFEAKNVSGHVLGNYRELKRKYVLPYVRDKVVVDLGSFDGKWTYTLLDAERLICVDIVYQGFPAIVKKYPFPHINFYQTDGDNLKEIEDNSVDFIFSMDSLVRSEEEIIDSYIKEFKRVLKPDGRSCVHLPCQKRPLSHELGFTQISQIEITAMCWKHGLNNFVIDSNIINHGVLLLINYGL